MFMPPWRPPANEVVVAWLLQDSKREIERKACYCARTMGVAMCSCPCGPHFGLGGKCLAII